VNEDHFELAVDLTAPACARWRIRLAALTWGLPGLADDAELLASELVTNAVRASDGRGQAVVQVWLVADHDSLVLAVWDGGDGLPARYDVGPFDPGGRGLTIVDTLSASWGAYATVPGKVVWAVVSAKDIPPEWQVIDRLRDADLDSTRPSQSAASQGRNCRELQRGWPRNAEDPR
jgi:hypothetical protein